MVLFPSWEIHQAPLHKPMQLSSSYRHKYQKMIWWCWICHWCTTMVKPFHNTCNLLKFEDIIKRKLTIIPSTKSIILGWAGMFMSPKIYTLSESNPWQDSANLGAIPTDIENSTVVDTECKHHYHLWKSLKNQHDSLTNIEPALNQCNKLVIMNLKPHWTWKCRQLFRTYGSATATDIVKIDETIKTPWDPMN